MEERRSQSRMPSSTSSSSSFSKSFRRRACCSSLFFFCHILNKKMENPTIETSPRHIITNFTPMALLDDFLLVVFVPSLEFTDVDSLAKPSKRENLFNKLPGICFFNQFCCKKLCLGGKNNKKLSSQNRQT